MRLADLSAYNTAAKRSVPLSLAATLAGSAAAAAVLATGPGGGLAAMSSSFGASLAIAAAGAASAAAIAGSRALALRAEGADGAAFARPGLRELLARRAKARAGWQQAALGGLLAGVAFGAASLAACDAASWQGTPAEAGIAATAFLGAAFVVLVLERHLAVLDPLDLPEACSLAPLLRVPIAVSMLCGVGCLLTYAGVAVGGVHVGAYAGRVSAVLCLLVSGEMAARALSTLFVPFPPPAGARISARSAIAGALVLKRPPPVASTIRDVFGIDLSRSWALAFMHAAFLPVLAVLALFGWLLSGVDALHVDQRAIYERFGTPVAVLGPGLHLRLPWPAGRLRPVELGVVHDVPIVSAGSRGESGAAAPTAKPAAAEGEPGPGADRLWDGAHPSEGSYIVANSSRGQQSFESVNVDLRVVYRVGLSDRAALEAAFSVSDPQRLLQARASRLLARYYAAHTLPGILGEDRASFSHDIQSSLQADLDEARSGLEVMAVVVEAIHPPPGAASAYHAVQAAQVDAHAAVARQSGIAVQSEIDARSDAAEIGNAADARSHETVADAQIRATLFASDRAADARNHESFVLERRFDQLAAGLAHRQVLIIDHRLQGAAAPTLDMRPESSGGIYLPPPAGQR